ncbi:EF-hand domain-containing protein [Trinickia dinghuensis]|uniref:EF-hand domain-containing protein n=1 Tax=Trinickia dinghuensis TaxID=2291023 RepID=A0A3D8JW25_9BURK|nr:EF-hand domain-containing protein [Trinickia dinghuensis]RDU97257.1 EF-hand domain-containing protein [Trinickia dinghuensis]
MKRMLITVAIFAFSTGAMAQVVIPATPSASSAARLERGLQTLHERFARANITHDGKLTRQQASAGMPMVARHFNEIDTRHAGFVTLAQIEAYFGKRAMSH